MILGVLTTGFLTSGAIRCAGCGSLRPSLSRPVCWSFLSTWGVTP